MIRKPRIAVVAIEDPSNFSTFSGIPWSTLQALESIGWDAIPVSCETRYRTLHRSSAMMQRLGLERSLIESKRLRDVLAKGVAKSLIMKRASAAIYSNRLLFSVRYPPPVPVALWIDHTVEQMLNYYPGYFDVPESALHLMYGAEWEAFSVATTVCFASTWALSGALGRYPEFESKFHVVPFGPNVFPDDISYTPLERPPAQVLTVAYDWERKGVETLFAGCEELRSEIPQLTLVGIGRKPIDRIVSRDWVTWYTDLSPKDQQSRTVLKDLFLKSSAFALMSKAECFGISVVEAGAFGLPLVVTETGGLPYAARVAEPPFLVFSGHAIRDVSDALRRALRSQGSPETWKGEHDQRSWQSRVRRVLRFLGVDTE